MKSNIIDKSVNKYYEKDGNILILGDIFETLSKIKKETIDKAKSIYHKRNASKSLSYSIINQNS